MAPLLLEQVLLVCSAPPPCSSKKACSFSVISCRSRSVWREEEEEEEVFLCVYLLSSRVNLSLTARWLTLNSRVVWWFRQSAMSDQTLPLAELPFLKE